MRLKLVFTDCAKLLSVVLLVLFLLLPACGSDNSTSIMRLSQESPNVGTIQEGSNILSEKHCCSDDPTEIALVETTLLLSETRSLNPDNHWIAWRDPNLGYIAASRSGVPVTVPNYPPNSSSLLRAISLSQSSLSTEIFDPPGRPLPDPGQCVPPPTPTPEPTPTPTSSPTPTPIPTPTSSPTPTPSPIPTPTPTPNCNSGIVRARGNANDGGPCNPDIDWYQDRGTPAIVCSDPAASVAEVRGISIPDCEGLKAVYICGNLGSNGFFNVTGGGPINPIQYWYDVELEITCADPSPSPE